MKKLITSALLLTAAAVASNISAENLYLYKAGKVIFSENVENIGRVAYEDNNANVCIYGAEGSQLFKAPVSEIDYLSNKHEAPVADLLDIVFKDNGMATDISPMANRVRAENRPKISIYYSKEFNRNVASFNSSWGSTVSANYRIDYGSNDEFRNGLADGHTLEVVIMANYDGLLSSDSNNKEAKCFASHQNGGTGIMICRTGNGSAGLNEFTFLPAVGSYRWATAGIAPEKGAFYHVVGVWDATEKVAKIYVNGKLYNTVPATGSYLEPTEKSRWFCIGGDSSDNGASNGWKGDIVLARIYDDPLTDAQVKALWYDVEPGCMKDNDKIVNDVTLYELPVKIGGYYPVIGSNFAEGDQFIFESSDKSFTLPSNVLTTEARVTIPEGFTSDTYVVSLRRGEETQRLGRVALSVVEVMPKPAGTIAHRGFWNTSGSAQNSRKSLSLAQQLGVYGSETDVWLTKDGALYCNHDNAYNGVTIETATAAQCANLKLSNGETMPTLGEFLTMIKESDSPTKLIIEIKTHSTTANTQACAKAVVEAVRAAGVSDKVEYIAFTTEALSMILQEDPDAICAYLSSNLTPQKCSELGHKSIDFAYTTYKGNKKIISQAHELGMTVNAWTFASAAEMIEATNLDIDLLTTDSPVESLNIAEYYRNNQ